MEVADFDEGLNGNRSAPAVLPARSGELPTTRNAVGLADMLPLRFEPILKRIRWGGRRLRTILGKPIGNETDYAESWEISCHPHGESVIAGGPYDGVTLKQLIENEPRALLGRHADRKRFPLLIKFLDASDRLSVQVHPNDAQAVRYRADENGKTEAWVILAAEPDSVLYAGLNEGVTAEQLRASLADGTVESCLHTVKVTAGDCFFIPAGTVHAIGEGVLLAEIQQSSDLTFRLYDWGRLGTDGRPRALHIDDALDCIDFDRGPVSPVTPESVELPNGTRARLVECPQFIMERHISREQVEIVTDNRFHVVMVLQGKAQYRSADESNEGFVNTGNTILIPASSADICFEPVDQCELVLLEAYLP